MSDHPQQHIKYFWEDLPVGRTLDIGSITVDHDEVIDFASKYDPQPFHLDANAAADSPYGGLIASGFQSIAVCFRLFIQSGIFAESSIGSPGLDELRWLAPVRPGDTLKSVVEVLDVRPSQSKPDRGIARLLYKAENQRGETVLSFIGNNMLKRSPAAAA